MDLGTFAVLDVLFAVRRVSFTYACIAVGSIYTFDNMHVSPSHVPIICTYYRYMRGANMHIVEGVNGPYCYASICERDPADGKKNVKYSKCTQIHRLDKRPGIGVSRCSKNARKIVLMRFFIARSA